MAEIFVRIRGMKEIAENLSKFTDIAERKLGIGMGKSVAKIAFDAKTFAPFRTGFLRDNIIPSVRKKKFLIIGNVISKAPYSVHQEFGTVNHSAHPFMRPSFKQNTEFVMRSLGRGLIEATFEAESKRKQTKEGLI